MSSTVWVSPCCQITFIVFVITLQEVPELATRAVVIIHHTDCGGQAVMRHHDMLVTRMQQMIAEWNWLLGIIQVSILDMVLL